MRRPLGNKEQGEAWKLARKKARVTQEELAQLIGYAKKDIIWRVERGDWGFFEHEERKIDAFLKERQGTNKPILRKPESTPSFAELKARYYTETNWVDAEHAVPYIAVFPLRDESPKLLARNQIRGGKILQQPFRIPPEKLSERLCAQIIESFKQISPGTEVHAGRPKARLLKAAYNAKNSTLTLEYGSATYYENLITHRLLDYRLLRNSEKQLDGPITLRDILIPHIEDGLLPPLGPLSPLANTVGRGGLVLTQDCHLVLVLRSSSPVADAGRFDLSVQGSADIVNRRASTYDVFEDYKVEAYDELIIETDAWERLPGNIEALWLMGLLRNAAQDGKPDFIFLGKTTDTADTVLKKAPHAEHNWENKEVRTLPPDTTIDELRMRLLPTSNHSAPCRAAISLLIRWAAHQGLTGVHTIADISTALCRQ